MYWRRPIYLALGCFMLATGARADIIPDDGKSFYRGTIEMYVDRLPRGIVLLYLPHYGATTSKVAEKQTLTIGQPGTLYAVKNTFAAGRTAVKTEMGEKHRLKDFRKYDLPVSRVKPDPIQRVTCAVTGNAASGYELSCGPAKAPW
jgi:hypothetical protein